VSSKDDVLIARCGLSSTLIKLYVQLPIMVMRFVWCFNPLAPSQTGR